MEAKPRPALPADAPTLPARYYMMIHTIWPLAPDRTRIVLEVLTRRLRAVGMGWLAVRRGALTTRDQGPASRPCERDGPSPKQLVEGDRESGQ